MKDTYEAGLWGEEFAAEYLTEKRGMVLLEQRYRTKRGEIDLIMTDGDTVVFVEVKTRRTGETGNGLSAVNLAKQKRITQAATLYLMQRNWLRKAVRSVRAQRSMFSRGPRMVWPRGCVPNSAEDIRS